jgi:hypothetical protein
MSIASVVRRGYVDSIASVVRRGYSTPASAPTLVGGVGELRLVQGRAAQEFNLAAIFAGSGITYSISPALEAEASFNTATGVLTWDPINAGTFGPYTVRATNSSGFVDSDAFNVVVQVESPAYEAFDYGLGFVFRFSY